MKRHTKLFISFAFLLLFGLGSCDKELDINTNPNQASEESITPELVLPNALHGVGVQTANAFGWLANWIGYWSASGSFNPSTEESSYNITNTFQENKWAGIYNVLFDLQKVEEKAVESNEPFYQAVAKVMKAHLYQYLVDIYGNVPYSQAFKPTEFPTPAYDDAQQIYNDLQVQLDQAIEMLKTADVTNVMAGADIVYNGDSELWIRLANTLKLRLLIRQTQVNANPTEEIAKIKANGGVLQEGESADANPGYQNDVGKQSPFYGAYGLLPSGQEANTFFRANAYTIDLLKVTGDPRLGRFFAEAKSPTNPSNPYVGTVYGSDPNTAFGGDQTSNIGPGLARTFNQPQWIVSSVESMFLQAEAIARGWDIGGPYVGDPQAAYEAAVKESFVWLTVPDPIATAEAFLLTAGPNWANAGSSVDEMVDFIAEQKYIALIGINPLEAWNDYRRLGVPEDVPLSVNQARGNRLIPVRLLYPSAEYAVNAASVQAQGNITPYSTIFWDK